MTLNEIMNAMCLLYGKKNKLGTLRERLQSIGNVFVFVVVVVEFAKRLS